MGKEKKHTNSLATPKHQPHTLRALKELGAFAHSALEPDEQIHSIDFHHERTKPWWENPSPSPSFKILFWTKKSFFPLPSFFLVHSLLPQWLFPALPLSIYKQKAKSYTNKIYNLGSLINVCALNLVSGGSMIFHGNSGHVIVILHLARLSGC